MSETWRAIVGFEGYYEVSDLRNVRSIRTNFGNPRCRPVKALRTHDGYLRVCLSKDNVQTKKHVAHAVLEAFVGPRPPGAEACHGPRGQRCNELSNLRWDTKAANYDERTAAGTGRGEQHGCAQIDEDTARRIKVEAADPTKLARDIASTYGTTFHVVRNIRNGKTWAWL